MNYLFSFVILFAFLEGRLMQNVVPPGLEQNDLGTRFEVFSKTETTYPYQCPYRDPRFTIEGNPHKLPFWASKKHPEYGYFEKRGAFNRLISVEPEIVEPETASECLYEIEPDSDRYVLTDCNVTGVYGACVYHPRDERFCPSYHSICKRECSGKSKYKSQFACGAVYDEGNADCERCDEEFEKYPEPSIHLYRETETTLALVIKNRGKLAKEYDGSLKLHCVSGMNGDDVDRLWYEVSEDMMSRELINDDIEVIRINYLNILNYQTANIYSCEVIAYKDLTLLTSEDIVIDSEYEHLTINITVDMVSQGMPYKIHIDQQEKLKYYLFLQPPEGVDVDFAFVPIFAVLYPQTHDKKKIILTFLASMKKGEEDIENVEFLKQILPSSYSVACSEYCLPEKITVGGQTLSWPKTRVGKTVPTTELIVTKNNFPITRSCTGSFKQGGFWAAPILEPSADPTDITQELYDILTNEKLTAAEVNVRLLETISGPINVTPYDVYLVAKCLERVIESGEAYDVEVAVRNVETTMDFDRAVLRSSQINLNATDMILYCYDMIVVGQAGGQESPVIVRGEKTIGQVVSINSTFNGIAIYQKSDGISVVSLSVQYEEEITKTDLMIASYFPKEVLHRLKNFDIFLVTSVFLDNKLFNEEKNWPDWQVMNMFLTGAFNPFVSEGLPVIFGERYRQLNEFQSCGYWKYGINNQLAAIFGKWKKDGRLVSGSNYKICKFDHTTHFALLFDAPEDKGIEIVTAIMTSFSLFCLLFIFLTAICFRKWRREDSTKILLNYSAAIMLQDVLILVFDLVQTDNVFCTIYGVLLHFSVLAQFTWMLIITYVQYRKLVKIFQSGDNAMKLIMLAWVIPLLPIITILSINVYSYTNTNYCFIRDLNLYLGLFLPISLIIFVNIILFSKIAISIFGNKTNAVGKSLLKYKINICVLLFFLSGFTWTFGLLASAFQSIVLSYIFCTLAIGQALLLWIYFIIGKKEVTDLWKEKLDVIKQGALNLSAPPSVPTSQTETSASSSK